MADRVRVIGSYISPYVRKALVALDLKGIPYEIDPIVPFLGDDRFTALSPLRRVPVLIDGELKVWESLAICEYASELAGGRGWPSEPRLRAPVTPNEEPARPN